MTNTYSHHPECRIRESNECTCEWLYRAEERLAQIRTVPRKPKGPERIPPMPVWLACIAAGAFIQKVFFP